MGRSSWPELPEVIRAASWRWSGRLSSHEGGGTNLTHWELLASTSAALRMVRVSGKTRTLCP
jgi:hypothetical protein